MTDRVRTLTVLLDEEMRTDDIERVVSAIQMVKRVSAVKLGEADVPWQARMELREKFAKAMRAFYDEIYDASDIF